MEPTREMMHTLKWLCENQFIEMATEILKRATLDGTLDPQVQEHMNLWNVPGWVAFNGKKFDIAERHYRTMIESIQEREKKDKRQYHKGMAYHNLAIAISMHTREIGQVAETRELFKRAYEEDVRTKGKETARKGLAREALNVIEKFEDSIESKVLGPVSRNLTCQKCGNPLIQGQYCIYCGSDQKKDKEATDGLRNVIDETMKQIKEDIATGKTGK